MRKLSTIAAGLTLLVLASAMPRTANAGWPGFGGYYSVYSMDSIPYFAMHPPVYYSYPVPRTYGYSPFAYPPSVMTPEVTVEVAPPKLMKNPYAPRQISSDHDRTTANTIGPQVMINPYVDRAEPANVANSDRR